MLRVRATVVIVVTVTLYIIVRARFECDGGADRFFFSIFIVTKNKQVKQTKNSGLFTLIY